MLLLLHLLLLLRFDGWGHDHVTRFLCRRWLLRGVLMLLLLMLLLLLRVLLQEPAQFLPLLLVTLLLGPAIDYLRLPLVLEARQHPVRVGLRHVEVAGDLREAVLGLVLHLSSINQKEELTSSTKSPLSI